MFAPSPLTADLETISRQADSGGITVALGNVLRRQRKELRLTLRDIAWRTGLSIGYISAGKAWDSPYKPSSPTHAWRGTPKRTPMRSR